MNRLFILRCATLVSAISLLAACAPLGKQSPLESPTAYSLPKGRSTPSAPYWWRQLNDPQLNRLVNRALATSPDLRAAQARFNQAQAQLGITEAADKTQIGLTAQGAGIYVSPKPSSPYGDTGNTLKFANLAVQSSWVFDFWGKNRARIRSVLGQKQAVAYEAEQARLTVAQAVAAQYFSLQSLSAQEKILQERIALASETETLLRQRIQAQLLPGSALYPAEQAQLLLQSQLLELQRQSARLRHSLATLCGQAPNALDNFQPTAISNAPSLRINNIRADLLSRRPDIAAQKALLLSRSEDITAVKAEFYPNIELKLLAGLSHIDAFNIVNGKNSAMLGLLPAVNLPIFTSGALQSRLAMSRAEYNRQIALYDQTVLNAMRSAADAVSDYQILQEQANLQKRAEQTANKSATASQRRVRAGLDSKLTYLQKQDAALQQQQQSVKIQADLLTSWSNLHAQLGGGFKAE
ncbi:membrane protein [Neisseria arctica]|uniref:Membrane protein n=1 Tax=Neisseria arctica TaxID=1470200 RepID=A0A0J0YSR6_9NEIS|nr:efflux transporter outer membrane subunit [Neisseria arctica]KLT73137.1 membrane protein [Neisseria arctica]UOO87131.1 efflux transporter outer membrane subunit [Neisseria arctica]